MGFALGVTVDVFSLVVSVSCGVVWWFDVLSSIAHFLLVGGLNISYLLFKKNIIIIQ